MKLYTEDIKQDILKKAVSKFTFDGKKWEIYETIYRGNITPSYNLIDVEEPKISKKLKRFNSLSEALDFINFREE